MSEELIKLKAVAYDLIAQIENLQKQLRLVNDQIIDASKSELEILPPEGENQ